MRILRAEVCLIEYDDYAWLLEERLQEWLLTIPESELTYRSPLLKSNLPPTSTGPKSVVFALEAVLTLALGTLVAHRFRRMQNYIRGRSSIATKKARQLARKHLSCLSKALASTWRCDLNMNYQNSLLVYAVRAGNGLLCIQTATQNNKDSRKRSLVLS